MSRLPPPWALGVICTPAVLALVLAIVVGNPRAEVPEFTAAADQEPLKGNIRAVPAQPEAVPQQPESELLNNFSKWAEQAKADAEVNLERTKELAENWFGFVRVQTPSIEHPWTFTLYSYQAPPLRVGDQLLYDEVGFVVIATGYKEASGRVYHTIDATRSPEDFKLVKPLHPEAKVWLVDEKTKRVSLTDIAVPQ